MVVDEREKLPSDPVFTDLFFPFGHLLLSSCLESLHGPGTQRQMDRQPPSKILGWKQELNRPSQCRVVTAEGGTHSGPCEWPGGRLPQLDGQKGFPQTLPEEVRAHWVERPGRNISGQGGKSGFG